MTFDEARALFPVLERFAYLNAGTLGPLSGPTLAAMEERLRFDQEQGRGGHGWFMSVLELRTRVREQLAALIGSSTAQVALTIQIASVAQLAKVMSRVEQLKDVISAQRELG